MKSHTTTLLTGLALLLASSEATAFGLHLRLNPGSDDPGHVLQVSDELIVDVYLDAEPGLTFLGVRLLFEDDGILGYDQNSSFTPSYILYAPGSGGEAPTYLIPNVVNPGVDPPNYWNGFNEPGTRAIVIEYLEPRFAFAQGSGTDVWLATITLDVLSVGDGNSNVELTLDPSGTIVEAYGNDVKGDTTVTGSIAVTTIGPEIGGAVTGLDAQAVVCANNTAGQRLGAPIDAASEWDCSAVPASAGERLAVHFHGTVDSADGSVGGSVTGMTLFRVGCVDNDTGQSVLSSPSGTEWNCSGLGAAPGGSVSVRLTGPAD